MSCKNGLRIQHDNWLGEKVLVSLVSCGKNKGGEGLVELIM